MNFADIQPEPEPKYIHLSEHARLPLTDRFLGFGKVFWGSTVRISVKGNPLLFVRLHVPGKGFYIGDHRDVRVTYEDIRDQNANLGRIVGLIREMTAALDYQVAYYTASNLWC